MSWSGLYAQTSERMNKRDTALCFTLIIKTQPGLNNQADLYSKSKCERHAQRTSQAEQYQHLSYHAARKQKTKDFIRRQGGMPGYYHIRRAEGHQ